MNINKNWTFYRLNKPEEKINVDLPYDAMLREPRDISHLGGDKVSFFKGEDYGYEKVINIKKSKVEERLADIDLLNITPIEALNILYELKKMD